MASTYMTPGVYIEEKNAFPNSAVAVETAVPVFIGYTETAAFNSNSLLNKPTRITSFAEYMERFGAGFKAKYTVTKVPSNTDVTAITDQTAQDAAKAVQKNAATLVENTIVANNATWYIEVATDNTSYLYNSIRMFYANGGAICYILSVGTYAGKDSLTISGSDFLGSDANPISPFDLLKKESEPTLVVIPDAIALGADAYNTVYTTALQHCNDMQSRFAILDLKQQISTDTTDAVVGEFRDAIGVNNLNYGAAYYPWLKSALVQPGEVDLDNLDLGSITLTDFLPEPIAQKVITKYATDTAGPTTDLATAKAALATAQSTNTAADIASSTVLINDLQTQLANIKQSYLQSLKAVSPTYGAVLEKVRAQLNELPPSGAMAGLYTAVDNSRGVWKAPANVSVSMVNAPSVNISNEGQQTLNVDVMAGKSINVIRSFPGVGTLVWGGRTLDGNSQDWRYINVRRTLIMIEQSLKLAARAYVFEPNDANTWITVKSMFDNFLVNLWKQGALAGAAPEQAFDVQIGLGSTMTGNDILDGKMLITVKVAIVRPAEFIVITFQQQMQQS
ncbi:phage tail sheath family protein [Mucilaginibacter sp.]